MKTAKNLIFIVFFTFCTISCKVETKNTKPNSIVVISNPEEEVFYHLFQRSFYDSNNDFHGDLNGVTQKISYFKELGVTSLLMTPLYKSIYYHNYFPDDFKEIDPKYGTEEDYFKMVKALHKNDLKFYMDMEIHYVTKNHIWFKDSYKNEKSKYSNHIIYNGEGNTKPESMIFNLTKLDSYDGSSVDITTVDLHNREVLEYFKNLFAYWVDPNEDGNFDDGVDGFRIDHMMDDIDWKGIRKDLFVKFWKPIFTHIKSINPNIKIFGEQANWNDTGEDYFNVAGVDMMFAFNLREAILSFNKEEIKNKIDTLLLLTPKDKSQLVFLENHDTPRYASVVEGDEKKLKLGGFLMLFSKGIPSIYYGQELGMKGAGGFGKFGMSDGNDIPMREAFEWTRTINNPGMALWYKNTGPWWDQTNLKDNDGISLEEQKNNPNSIFNFYKEAIKVRQSNSSFSTGTLQTINNNSNHILTFLRSNGTDTFLIAVNTSSEAEEVDFTFNDANKFSQISLFFGSQNNNAIVSNASISVKLTPFAYTVWKLQ